MSGTRLGLILEAHESKADHLPAHIHAKRRGAWEIRVYFLLCAEGSLEFDYKWGRGVTAAFKSRILQKVLEHQAALLVEWETKVCRST